MSWRGRTTVLDTAAGATFAQTDVNASDNVRLIVAAARYGPAVRALPDEAGRTADLTVCPADLMTDRITILVDGKVVWSRGVS